jgi:uncharacterized membrane protein YhaH (DUF805 family)
MKAGEANINRNSSFLRLFKRLTPKSYRNWAIAFGVIYIGFTLKSISGDNFWDALPFWSFLLVTLTASCAIWWVTIMRFMDIGKFIWLPTIAFISTILAKTLIAVPWFFQTNREFEIGVGFWIVLIEMPMQLFFLFISLFFVLRPSMPTTNKYGPNPLEVST